MSKKYHTALKLAIETAGGQAQLAEICGCSKQAIHQAVVHERGLSAKQAVKVEEKLGISRHVTRPDIFGPPEGTHQ